MQLARILLAMSTAVAVAAGSATATAAPSYTAVQGDKILIGAPGSWPSSSCTLGYNADGYSYTAAHCGHNGDLVYLEDSHGRPTSPVGTLTRSDRAQTESFPGYNDWARIDWNNSVRLGPNRFSGDALVAPSELRLGKKCVFMVKRHVAKIVDASWEI